jgi:cysteine desulfurase
MDKPVYLDYAASTPVAPRVRDAMLPWLGVEVAANPHASHSYGAAARAAIEQARGQVAALINARPEEIIFTSGATEANNLAIKGAALFQQRHSEKRHIVVLSTEHSSVLEACAALDGFEVTHVPVQPDGLVDMAVFEAALRLDTFLVSIMTVHNETGVIQRLAPIGRLCRALGITLHTDAAQAFGKIPLDVEALQVDLLSVSGHKAYAPQGVGALYVRRQPRARIEALLSGGGQERGLRAGTVSTPMAVALGVAASMAQQSMAKEAVRLVKLREQFLKSLKKNRCDFYINGHPQLCYAGILNLGFPGVTDSSALLEKLPQLAASTGSACRSASDGVSPVLRAMGREQGGVRLSFGRFTTPGELDATAEMLAAALQQMRAAA